MSCSLIVAYDKNLGIGKNQKIPWNLPLDMKGFRQLTQGKHVVMGVNTLFSLPNGPLKNRTNIVVTQNHYEDVITKYNDDIKNNLLIVVKTVEDAIDVVKNTDYFVIGGRSIYEAFMKHADTIYVTEITNKSFDCDVFFPKIPSYFTICDYSEKFTENDMTYRFITYENKNINELNKQSITTNETTYLNLLQEILDKGSERSDRTGTGTLSVFGRQLRFDISNSIPALTTKQLAWKTCIKELIWFLKGQTDSNILKEQGVNIWNLNSTREFLDERGLTDLPEGDIGAGYGFQWRHFGAEYKNANYDYSGQGIDQIKDIIKQIKTDPYSRRHLVSAWNPLWLHRMALPPCHVMFQFYIDKGKLSCHMYQRSVDCFLGLPFNIFSYAALTYIIAKICDLEPNELIISTGDTHIYKDHIDAVKTQLSRAPYASACLIIDDKVKNKDIKDLSIDDFELLGYFSHPSIKATMSA